MKITFEIGNKFIDVEEGNIFTVTDLVSDSSELLSVILTDENGISTIYPEHFNDGIFTDWFEPYQQ